MKTLDKKATSAQCIVCDHDETDRLYDQLLKCKQCGYIWADVEFSKENVIQFYNNNYFFGKEYMDYIKEEQALKKNFLRHLKIIKKFKSSGKLLEIGSAYGFFLDLAKEDFEVEGIEINASGCRHTQEKLDIKAVCDDFLETEYEEESFDIIVMWATLEHLRHPHLYIQKINRLLKEGGIFACAVPDIGSLLARIQKESWRQIMPPEHLNYFSEVTLEKLLARNGFQKRMSIRLGEYRTVDYVLYLLCKGKGWGERFYSFLKRWKLNRGMFYLNTFDTLTMIASKEKGQISNEN